MCPGVWRRIRGFLALICTGNYPDVQWMTAGRGVQHSEMFPLLNTEGDNTLELFQIWLNLPRQGKFVDPHFKMLWRESIPRVDHEGVSIRVIAGEYQGQKPPDPAPDSWAHDPENQVAIWNISMEVGSKLILPKVSKEVNRSIYYYKGDGIFIDENAIEVDYGINISDNGTIEINNGNGESKLLLLQGKPINEPVAKYGPFVMNTQAEIQQAFEEYRLTRFGGWPWPHPDHVHAREKGRFALYPDGQLEEK